MLSLRCWFITRAHNKRRAADFMMLNHKQRLPTNYDASGSWSAAHAAMLPPLVAPVSPSHSPRSAAVSVGGGVGGCWQPAASRRCSSLSRLFPSALRRLLSLCFFSCVSRTYFPWQHRFPRVAPLPLMFRLHNTIRFEFHLEGLEFIFPAAFIPAALLLRDSIREFFSH